MKNLDNFFMFGTIQIEDLNDAAYVSQTKRMVQNGLDTWKDSIYCPTEDETIHWTCPIKRIDTLSAGRAEIKFPGIIKFYSQAGFPKKVLNLQNSEEILSNILDDDEELRFLLYNFLKDQIIMKIIKEMSVLKVPS